MRQAPDIVDGGDAVGKARKQLIQLPLLALQLVDRLREVIAERVERAREDNDLARRPLGRADAASLQFDCSLARATPRWKAFQQVSWTFGENRSRMAASSRPRVDTK